MQNKTNIPVNSVTSGGGRAVQPPSGTLTTAHLQNKTFPQNTTNFPQSKGE